MSCSMYASPGAYVHCAGMLADGRQSIRYNYASLAFVVVAGRGGTWNDHSVAIAGDPALQQAIITVLLQHSLPAVAAALPAEASAGLLEGSKALQVLEQLACTLRHASLASAVDFWGAPPAAATSVAHAVATLRCLLPDQPGGQPSDAAAAAFLPATVVLAICCRGAVEAFRRAKAAGGAAAASVDSQAGGACLRIATLLPRLMPAIAQLLGSPPSSTESTASYGLWMADQNVIVASLAPALYLLQTMLPVPCSHTQLTIWLRAACASLRLLPRLAQLDVQLQQHVPSRSTGAQLLCRTIIHTFVVGKLPWLPQRSASEPRPAEAAAWDGLAEQVCALHTSMCRLVAALTAPAASLSLPGMQLAADGWQQLCYRLDVLLLLLVDVQQQKLQFADTFDFLAYAPRRVAGAVESPVAL